MLLHLLALLAGGVLLYFGADWLVGGSSGLARSFGVRPLVIGLTVVAYGTSMPEAVVSGVAAWEESGAIVFGNVIGSNIANLGLILGITAVISPPRVEGTMVLREVPVLLASALVPPVLLLDGALGRIDAAILLGMALGFTAWTLRTARAADVPEAEPAPRSSLLRLGLLALAGLMALIAGGKLFVTGASGFARMVGLSERVVGLTIVAVGTSLPELAASLLAALRGHSALAVGNVVGSNIFNSFLILGLAGLIRPVVMPLERLRTDFVVLGLMTGTAAVMLRGDRVVSRTEGAVLTMAYVGFLAALGASGR